MFRSLPHLGVLALALALAACQQAAPATPGANTAGPAAAPSSPAAAPQAASSLPPLEAAFKGWELYAWEAQGQWRYSLVWGTNATKSTQMITTPNATDGFTTAMVGTGPLIAQMERLPKGEQIFWSTRPAEGDQPALGRPPAAQEEAIVSAAARLGLVLHLPLP